MSHFTVMVFGDNAEEQLAPFQENNMGDCPKKYMVFYDADEQENYEKATIEAVRLVSGEVYFKHDDRFEVVEQRRVYPEGSIIEQVLVKELYPTKGQWYEEYLGYKKDPVTGRYGYWYNPNSKWDWYQLGGRWVEFFKLKKGTKGTKGTPGIMTEAAKEGYADSAYKRDIDFEGMIKEAKDKAEKLFDKVLEAFNGNIPKLAISWEKAKEQAKGDVEKARKLYRTQEAKIKEKEIKYKEENEDICWINIEEFQCSKEEYLKKAGDKTFATFAVIKDGKWYEQGSMGWWGCVSNEKDQDIWNMEVRKLIEEVSDDMVISVYDCHI